MIKETIKLNLYVWGLYLLTLGYFAIFGYFPKDYLFFETNIFPLYTGVFCFISIVGSILTENHKNNTVKQTGEKDE